MWTLVSFKSGDEEVRMYDLVHEVNFNTKLNDMFRPKLIVELQSYAYILYGKQLGTL